MKAVKGPLWLSSSAHPFSKTHRHVPKGQRSKVTEYLQAEAISGLMKMPFWPHLFTDSRWRWRVTKHGDGSGQLFSLAAAPVQLDQPLHQGAIATVSVTNLTRLTHAPGRVVTAWNTYTHIHNNLFRPGTTMRIGVIRSQVALNNRNRDATSDWISLQPYIYTVYILYIYSIYSIYTVYIYILYIYIYTQYIYIQHIYTMYIYSIYIYTVYIQYIYILCIYIYTVYIYIY